MKIERCRGLREGSIKSRPDLRGNSKGEGKKTPLKRRTPIDRSLKSISDRIDFHLGRL